MALDAGGELELEQNGLDHGGRQGGLANDFVDCDRSRPEQVSDEASCRLVRIGGRRRRRVLADATRKRAAAVRERSRSETTTPMRAVAAAARSRATADTVSR